MLFIALDTELTKREFMRKFIPEKMDEAQVVASSRLARLTRNICCYKVRMEDTLNTATRSLQTTSPNIYASANPYIRIATNCHTKSPRSNNRTQNASLTTFNSALKPPPGPNS